MLKRRLSILVIFSAIGLTACNSGSGTQSSSGNEQSSSVMDFSTVKQYATPFNLNKTENNVQAVALGQSAGNSCFDVANSVFNNGQWWSSGSFNIVNKCSTAQSASGIQVVLGDSTNLA